ncbi:MAG: alpha/beta fold hydrolase [Gammaproteobacteria bacterium]|nr:MAG: alpha/beta fold hydrolase [Gammaproteobacteria bacterium]
MLDAFDPGALLRPAHAQTILSSLPTRQWWLRRAAAELEASSEVVDLTTDDDVHLRARVAVSHAAAPLVILIHGWLGGDRSSYMLSNAMALRAAGFNVARLNMRDHGDTEALNEVMFNSGRIGEIIDASAQLARTYGCGGAGLMGFSLGANFALRAASSACGTLRLPTLAVCPVIEPGPSAYAIDHGWYGYRLYFVRRWRRAFAAKQRAFPDDYDLRDAMRLSSVEALTDYFVERFTPYRDSEDYFSHYSLANDLLEGLDAPTQIVAAADDPVIPLHGYDRLPHNRHLSIKITRYGGHCGFVETARLKSRIDRLSVQFFERELGRPPDSEPARSDLQSCHRPSED